jgi:hypothetical protein
MADDIKQEDGENPAPQQGREFASRRRVLMGLAASVPVVMTVTSGEALANASSLQCIGKPTPHPPKWIKKDGDDGWYRRKKLYKTKDSGKKIYKKRLMYVDKWGQRVHPDHIDAQPFTQSCHNSFLPKK